MILADKIINERKRNGWSQEELAEQLDVSRQSISKWESAQAIPDIQKIIRMADIFGVSTDYLLKDEMEPADMAVTPVSFVESDQPDTVKVSMEEANDFLDAEMRRTPRFANMVSLCVIAPAVLLAALALSMIPGCPLSEGAAVAIGTPAILVLVGIAVFFFIVDSEKMARFRYLETSPIETLYGVDGMVRERRGFFEQKRIFFTAIGVLLCVLSPVPLIAVSILTAEGYLILFMVALLLLIVSIGVNFLVRACNVAGAFNKLLQEGDYTRAAKVRNPLVEKVSSIYWLLVTAAFFIWSFGWNDWQHSWIIWPIAGVVFGIICAICSGDCCEEE